MEGVKAIWKVLKPKDRLPSSRADSNDEVPTTWSVLDDTVGGGDNVETQGEDNP